METSSAMVCIHCTTYNHQAFLEDALKGFVMQQTSFPFVAVVIDDCSTDNTAQILRKYETEYPEIIKAVYLKENYYSQHKPKKPFFEPFDRDATYIALCEGDDYWTDPLKLQKQVDFLETHPDYSLCFHRVLVQSDLKIDERRFNHLEEREFSAREIYEKWTIPTCSAVYRKSSYQSHYIPHKDVPYGDIHLWLQLAEVGKVYCLDFCGGVYRRHRDGRSVKWNLQQHLKLYRQYLYFEKRFPYLKDIARRDQNVTLEGIIYAPYFKGIWKYRFLYMLRHPKLFFSPFFTTTILSYTPLRQLKKKYRDSAK